MTRRVPARVQEELERLFALAIHDSELPPRREELLQRVRGAAGLVSMLTDRVDADLFDAAGPQLRVVANYAVGMDNVDVDEARRRGIVCANTPAVLTRATAELTLALALALARRSAARARRRLDGSGRARPWGRRARRDRAGDRRDGALLPRSQAPGAPASAAVE